MNFSDIDASIGKSSLLPFVSVGVETGAECRQGTIYVRYNPFHSVKE